MISDVSIGPYSFEGANNVVTYDVPDCCIL